MATKPVRRHFTVAEYYRMGEAGILNEDDRVELIEGDIIQMPPIGDPHAWCVNRLTRRLVIGLGDSAIVGVQNPFRLSTRSEPVPDLVVMQPRPQLKGPHPTPNDVLLVIEVSDTTLRYDQGVKLPLYARESVPEVWIPDLNGDCLWVYREPSQTGYGATLRLQRGDHVAPLAFPHLDLAVDEILG